MALLPAVAGGEPAGRDPIATLRAVELASGKVAQAAAALQQTADEVAAAERLTALARMEDQQAALERALVKLQRAVAAAEATLPADQTER
ncbi:MAG: hypothetical protein ABIO70_30080 [Pseudomonadota bacterium]